MTPLRHCGPCRPKMLRLKQQNCNFFVAPAHVAPRPPRHVTAPLAAAACRDGGGLPPQRRLGRGQRAPPRRDSDRPRVRVTRRRQSGAVTARAEAWSRRGHDRCMPGRPPPTPTPLKDIFAPPVGRSRRRQACLCTYINIAFVDAYPSIFY